MCGHDVGFLRVSFAVWRGGRVRKHTSKRFPRHPFCCALRTHKGTKKGRTIQKRSNLKKDTSDKEKYEKRTIPKRTNLEKDSSENDKTEKRQVCKGKLCNK